MSLLGSLVLAVPLVFVHGIKGSSLHASDGTTSWLSTGQALGLTTSQLALPPRFDGDIQARDDLKAGSVLAEIVLIPWLAEVSIYGPWLAAARGFGGPFHPFAYDWRRDNRETVLALEVFLDELKASSGGPVDVVAHSMGGLITLSLVHKRPDLFRRVAFAGVPFRGGIGFLVDLHVGVATGLNERIAGPDVLATFPSVFSLFPQENKHLLNADLTLASMDFFDAPSWQRNSLGPFRPGVARDDTYRVFFEKALRASKAFRETLAHRPGHLYPPILNVSSKAHPTISRAILGGPNSENGIDFATSAKVPGDGRVAYQTSQPPEGIRFDEVLSEFDHTDMLGDPVVTERIRAFLAAP